MNPVIKAILANMDGVGRFRRALAELEEARRTGQVSLDEYFQTKDAISTVGLGYDE